MGQSTWQSFLETDPATENFLREHGFKNGSENIRFKDSHLVEAMDRIRVAQEFLDNSLLHHSLIRGVPEYRKMAEDSIATLSKLYQKIGHCESIDDVLE